MKKIAVLSVLLIFLTSFAFAGTIDLPKTGQTKCYDTAGVDIPCAGTGQDGDILAGVPWPDPRFTTNGSPSLADTTITDNLTGLVWASNANIMPTRDPGWDKDALVNDGCVTWQHALDYVAKLNGENYLGHSDWYLPNVNELESLVNAGEENGSAVWLKTQGFTNVATADYWSSTNSPVYTYDAWYVEVSSGQVRLYEKSFDKRVWPVRSGPNDSYPAPLWKTGQTITYYQGDDGDLQKGVAWPNPRFTSHDGTVTDNLTGLMWIKNAQQISVIYPGAPWQQTLDYVKGMNNGTYENFGYTDWRLPNRKELYSLTDFSRYNPSLPSGHPFTNVQNNWYWSSTTYASYTLNAWSVWGGTVFFMVAKSYYDYQWPVRGGQTGPLGDLDISVTKTASPDPVSVGNNLTYTVVVTNNGPETGTGVTLTDTLPSSVTYVSASSTKGTPTKSGNTVTCSIGTLSSGASATVTIVVTPTTAGTITNTASVTCNETDTNSSNNIATESTTVNALTDCSTWEQVIAKYQKYVAGQAGWTDVIECYQEYAS